MLVLKTSQGIWLFTALPSIDRVVGGINLKCWSFVQRKEKGTTLTISSNSLFINGLLRQRRIHRIYI
jgi:hypothetical protein